jgi:hypothetical protein
MTLHLGMKVAALLGSVELQTARPVVTDLPTYFYLNVKADLGIVLLLPQYCAITEVPTNCAYLVCSCLCRAMFPDDTGQWVGHRAKRTV